MKNKTPDFAYHMTKFFTEYLPIQRNLSPNSIATYRDTFRLLLLFYDTEKHIKPNLLTLDMLNVQQIEDNALVKCTALPMSAENAARIYQ